MFLKKNTKNLRSLFNVFAMLGLAITALWWGANTSTINAQVVRGTLFDFTGEGRTDFTTLVFNPNGNITWNIVANPVNPVQSQQVTRRFNFGLTGDGITFVDVPVPRDYVGDGQTEVAVYRTTNSTYYLAQFPSGTGGIMLDQAVRFGNAPPPTDNPGAEGDYDGDGKDDYTIVRLVGGTVNWLIMSSRTNTFKSIPFGRTDIAGFEEPVFFQGADFTADGRDELVFATTNSTNRSVNYYVGDSNTGVGVITRSFGNFDTDFSVTPADYTGDRRADFVAVRQNQGPAAIWYINNSATNLTTATAFGIASPMFNQDVPVRGDYDGDRRHDIAVYRPSNRTFYYISSFNNSIQGQEAGFQGEFPLASLGLY